MNKRATIDWRLWAKKINGKVLESAGSRAINGFSACHYILWLKSVRLKSCGMQVFVTSARIQKRRVGRV
ncbi:hypothetical protein [Marinobacter nauticus]|uniref:hypothetical protein n=1 Tax=Marinobacter nauticus TaxID=2743 RepID=UPI0012F885CE|nr:hypothetical protein [Marinobacter nauticus]